MLVVAQSIDEANELHDIIVGESFAGGRYIDRVLTVHSDAADEALEALESVGAADSLYRIVISVGMLKEGWDNKAVYVLASMRASVSTILTEQTLGRGLRLPFGKYTDIQLLDTLEVLAHERYEELLKKAGVLNEEFVSYRTRLTFQRDADNHLVPVVETQEVGADITVSDDGTLPGAGDYTPATPGSEAGADDGGTGDASAGGADGADQPAGGAPTPAGPVITSIEDYSDAADEELGKLQQELHPKHEVLVPRLRMTPVTVQFSLADITNTGPFAHLGQRIAADPVGELRRVTLSARTTKGPDGIWRTLMVTAPAVDRIDSPGALLPLEAARSRLAQQVLAAPAVPARAQEAKALAPLLDAFISGLGDKAEAVMSSYMDRAAAGFIKLITDEQRRFGAKPQFDEVIELCKLAPVRFSKRETDPDRMGKFKRAAGYEYKKSLFAQDWFDSSPERDVANILDNGNDITWWLRLQTGDLPILWAQGREYHPDFIARDKSDVHWVIEVKSDKDLPSQEVQAKREAAKRWANHVTTDPKVSVTWKYLLVSEEHVKTAKGSWPALKSLGE